MQELLSRTSDPNASVRGQEFYELRLDDRMDGGLPIYIVREAHAECGEEDGQIVWKKTHQTTFITLQRAEDRYAERRLLLAAVGFLYSDIDPIL